MLEDNKLLTFRIFVIIQKYSIINLLRFMMSKHNNLKSAILTIFAVFVVFMGLSNTVKAQCTYCAASTSWQYGLISAVYFEDINNESGWQSGVADYTKYSATVKPGQSYNIKVINDYYWDDYFYTVVFIDWNQDCDFYDKDERISLSTDDYGYSFYGKISVPTDAKSGNTRMRIRLNYYNYTQPCGSDWYGEIEDYTINVTPPNPDAAVVSIIPPTSPYTEGTYPVSMVLGNYGDGDLGSCTINWSVNGVAKTSVNWSGRLTKNQTTQISLGTHAFVFPSGGPFNPFRIDVWLTNISGFGTGLPDLNPANNSRTINTSPVTEDAGPIAISNPSGSFGPGVTNIGIRIKNFARKPLTLLDIDLFVDGVRISTTRWTGSLQENQTADVTVGQFNFQYKTPLAPFQITATTKNPNGITDPIPGNDTYTQNIAPSLVPGSFNIGGTNPHFATINGATTYLAAGGIIGNGDIIFNIRPGTYNEQININDCSRGNNTFTFQSSTGNKSDVIIDVTTNSSNWAIGINQLDDVILKNLTINVRRGTAAGANAIWANGSENLTLENLVINGVSNPTRNENFALVNLVGILNATFKNNVFNFGSHGVYYLTTARPKFVFTGNKFNNYNGYGIFNNMLSGSLAQPKRESDNKIQNLYSLEITNNDFVGSTIAGTGGLWLQSDALVMNNNFSNFAATTTGNAVIMINAPTFSGTLIEKNTINNATLVSGIVLNTMSSKINRNTLNLTTGTYTVAGISLSGSNNVVNYNQINLSGNTTSSGLITNSAVNAMITNNLIYANGPIALNVNSSTNSSFYYNTIVNNSTATNTIFNLGTNNFRRNLITNFGTGRSVLVNASTIKSSNNNFFTKGTTNNSDLTSWISFTSDITSTNFSIELTDDGNYLLNQFNDNVVIYEPLGIGDEFELYDYNGVKRDGYYYLGYSSISLDLQITQQPVTLLACNGDKNKQLEISAYITYGAKPKYQWYRDGIPIPGATEPVYKFQTITYETSGVFRCLVYGPANVSKGQFSDEVLVYTLRPTEIVRQSSKVKAPIGGTAFLEVEAHTKGITPPFFQHRYQWYRFVNGKEIQLMDNVNYANTRSPIMTITNLEDKHFTAEASDYYFVEVEGQCGIFRSKPIYLEIQTKDVVFLEQPNNLNVCIAGSANFKANAYVPGSNELINYQWYKDGASLTDDARITGSQTNALSISNVVPNDEGNYSVKAVASISGTERLSSNATLTVDIIPIFNLQPVDKIIKEGETLTLSAEATGTEPITYQWYKDDKKIEGATSNTYQVPNAELGMTGFYYCEAKNVCGYTKSTIVQVIVQKAGGVTNITEFNPFNLQITPNPVKNDILLSFETENEGKVDISILDLTGRVIYSMSVKSNNGLNSLSIDITNKVSNGAYFVKVNNGTQISIKQIIVTR